MQDAAARVALLQAYVEALPLAERVLPEVYEDRLSRCTVCPHLLEDLCTLCGCYAAAPRGQGAFGMPGCSKAPLGSLSMILSILTWRRGRSERPTRGMDTP